MQFLSNAMEALGISRPPTPEPPRRPPSPVSRAKTEPVISKEQRMVHDALPITTNSNGTINTLRSTIISLATSAEKVRDLLGEKPSISVVLNGNDRKLTKKDEENLKTVISKLQIFFDAFQKIIQSKKQIAQTNPNPQDDIFSDIKELFEGLDGHIGIIGLAKEISQFFKSDAWKTAKIFPSSNHQAVENLLRAFIEEARILPDKLLPPLQRAALVIHFESEGIAPNEKEANNALTHAHAIATYTDYNDEFYKLQNAFIEALQQEATKQSVTVTAKANTNGEMEIYTNKEDDVISKLLGEWADLNAKLVQNYTQLVEQVKNPSPNHQLLAKHTKSLENTKKEILDFIEDMTNGLIKDEEREKAKAKRQEQARQRQEQEKRANAQQKKRDEELAKSAAKDQFLELQKAKRATEQAEERASLPKLEELKDYQKELIEWVQNSSNLRDDVRISKNSIKHNKFISPLNTVRIRLYPRSGEENTESLKAHIQSRHPFALPYLYKIADESRNDLKPVWLKQNEDDKIFYSLAKIAFGDRTDVPEMATISDPEWEFRTNGAGNDTRPSIRVKTEVEIDGKKYKFGIILAFPKKQNQGITENEGIVKGLIMTGFELSNLS